jgi:hypothetical protein
VLLGFGNNRFCEVEDKSWITVLFDAALIISPYERGFLHALERANSRTFPPPQKLIAAGIELSIKTNGFGTEVVCG